MSMTTANICKFYNASFTLLHVFSKDKTIEIIKKFNFKKIKIIIEKDNGIYDAVNKGIKKSNGKVISILHSDDFYYNNDFIKKIILFF